MQRVELIYTACRGGLLLRADRYFAIKLGPLARGDAPSINRDVNHAGTMTPEVGAGQRIIVGRCAGCVYRISHRHRRENGGGEEGRTILVSSRTRARSRFAIHSNNPARDKESLPPIFRGRYCRAPSDARSLPRRSRKRSLRNFVGKTDHPRPSAHAIYRARRAIANRDYRYLRCCLAYSPVPSIFDSG